MFTRATIFLQSPHLSTTHWILQSVYSVAVHRGIRQSVCNTGTQYVVVVTGHSDKMLHEAHTWEYTTVQGIARCAWCSCSPWVCTRMVWGLHTCLYEQFRKVAANKTVQGDPFSTTEDSVPPWPRSDVCRPRHARKLNSRRLHDWRYTGEDSPAQPLAERDGLRVCAVQWAERLHWPGRWCSLFTAL